MWWFSWVQFSHSVVSNSSQPHGPHHDRPPCSSPTPRVYSNSSPSSQWCHPAISFSVVPFSSCLQFFPASGSFPVSQLFTSGGQSTGVSTSTSVLPMDTQDWFPLEWTGCISLQSKGLSICWLLSTNPISILCDFLFCTLKHWEPRLHHLTLFPLVWVRFCCGRQICLLCCCCCC